jgi:hypothetical protein
LRRLRLTIALSLRDSIDLETYEVPPVLAGALKQPPGRNSPDRIVAIGCLFDVLEATGWQMREAARLLGTTSAAIGRLLMIDDRVWRAAAQRRQALGLGPLRARS